MEKELPGPKTREFLERDQNAVGVTAKVRFYPLIVEEAKGVILKDVDGNEYIDFCAGGAVAGTGYSHPKILYAIKEQVEKVTHNAFVLHSHPAAVSLAEKLIELTPGQFEKKVWFGLSGSDANDCVYKTVNLATKRQRIISFMGGYYGQTMGAYSLSGLTALHMVMGLPNIVKVPYAYCYRCPFGLEHPSCGMQCVEYIEDHVFATICPPEDTSCLLVEPIQSDGGEIVPPEGYMAKLEELCKQYDILFAVDEVKHGFGRTGKMFAIEHEKVDPAIVVLGKSIASGMPLSAVVARKIVLDAVTGAHVFTVGGHPVSCAASLATLAVIQEEKLIENAKQQGIYILKWLEEMKDEYDIIGDVRGKGLIIGIELVKNRETKEPASAEAAKICYRAWELGLTTIVMGIHANVIEITPPLIITQEEAETGLVRLENAIKDVEMGKVADEKLAKYSMVW